VLERVLGKNTADREAGVTGPDHDGRDAFDGEPRRGAQVSAR